MEKQWYVVNTYSGHENKVKEKLEMRAESMDMQDYIFRVVIPEEKVVEVKTSAQGFVEDHGDELDILKYNLENLIDKILR